MRWTIIWVMALSLMACTTTIRQEPEDNASTLVVGQIMLDARAYVDYGDLTLTGKHTYGVKLTIRNLETNKTIYLTAGAPKGLFYFLAEPGVTYQIVEISYKDETGRSWYSLRSRPRNLLIYVEEEGVQNLGPIVWRSDNARKRYSISQTYLFETLKQEFAERYPESGWNAHTWLPHYF